MSNGSEHIPERERIPYETDEGVVVAVDLDGTIHRMKPLVGDEEGAQKAWEAYEESDAFAKDRTEVMHLPVDSVDTGPHSARAIGLSEALGNEVAGDIADDALLLGFLAGRESQRSRIAALEAVIENVKAWEKSQRVDHGQHFHSYPIDDSIVSWKTREARDVAALVDLAPSVVLDQMIREAKAEAVEAARDAIMPPVNWNLRPDGTEMPGTQHIDGALHDIHVQLTALATEIRNGDT